MLEQLVPLIRFCGFHCHAPDRFILLKPSKAKPNQTNMTFVYVCVGTVIFSPLQLPITVFTYVFLPLQSPVSPPGVTNILIFVTIFFLLDKTPCISIGLNNLFLCLFLNFTKGHASNYMVSPPTSFFHLTLCC